MVSELKDAENPISPRLTTKAGEIYNAAKVEDTIDAMTKELGNRGYAFVDIEPKLERDREQKLTNLPITSSRARASMSSASTSPATCARWTR